LEGFNQLKKYKNLNRTRIRAFRTVATASTNWAAACPINIGPTEFIQGILQKDIKIIGKNLLHIHVVASGSFGKRTTNVKYRTNKWQHPHWFSQLSSTAAEMGNCGRILRQLHKHISSS
jgi:hypothetical protein